MKKQLCYLTAALMTSTLLCTALPAGAETAGGFSAYERIQAERYDTGYGVDIALSDHPDATASDGGVVGWITTGDYMIYRNVDFGQGSPAESVTIHASGSVGRIKVCIDSSPLDGTDDAMPAAVVNVTATNGWNDLQDFTAAMSGVSGVHDVCLYFEADTGGNFVNVDYFSFGRPAQTSEPTETEPITSPLIGDLNLDGTVDILDVIIMNKYLLGVTSLKPEAEQNADADGNGVVDSSDSLVVLKQALGITEAPPEQLPDIVVTNYNISAVRNKPTADSTFTVDKAYSVYWIQNYHWNNAHGQTPGTITLLEDGEKIGEWTTTGTDGQGGVKNANWVAYPEGLVLKPGHSYQILDSDPDTWSQNSGSGGAGFFEIKGFPITIAK